jgi:hypothetical protein
MREKLSNREDSGLRVAPLPPEGSTPIDIALHYIRFRVSDVSRARKVAKKRAKFAVVSTSLLTGSIAVAGVATAVWHHLWIGLITAGLAGVNAHRK